MSDSISSCADDERADKALRSSVHRYRVRYHKYDILGEANYTLSTEQERLIVVCELALRNTDLRGRIIKAVEPQVRGVEVSGEDAQYLHAVLRGGRNEATRQALRLVGAGLIEPDEDDSFFVLTEKGKVTIGYKDPKTRIAELEDREAKLLAENRMLKKQNAAHEAKLPDVVPRNAVANIEGILEDVKESVEEALKWVKP